LLAPFALRPSLTASTAGRHARDYYGASAPSHGQQSATDLPTAGLAVRLKGDRGWFPRSRCDRSVREASSSTPAASPRLRRRPSTWPPHRHNYTASELSPHPSGQSPTRCTPAHIHQI